MEIDQKIVSFFFLALSIVLLVLGSIITAGAKKINDQKTKDDVSRSGVGIIIISIIFLIGSGVSLYSLYSSK